MSGPRVWRTQAAVVHPDRPAADLTAPVARASAEGPLRAAADAWMETSFAPPWEYESFDVVEALVDSDGETVQWAAVFTGCGQVPKTAPSWWAEWTPEDDQAPPADGDVS